MVSGKWNMAKILPGGGGKRVSGEKGISQLHPQGGVWTLQLSSAGVSICSSPGPFQILSYCPQQIGVALDHDGGKVTFTSARTQEFICEFSSAFTGRIFPFLWLNCMRSRLTLRPWEKTSWHSPRFCHLPFVPFHQSQLCLSWMVLLGFWLHSDDWSFMAVMSLLSSQLCL